MTTLLRFRFALLCCALATLAVPAPPASAAGDALELGEKVYKEHCLRCHGEQGRGDGADAVRLGFRPRDFTLGSFKCRCTPAGSLPRDEDLLRVVERGLPGTAMQGFSDKLSPAELEAVVEYVKSLTPAFADKEAPPCLEVPPAPAASAASVADGRQVYRLLRCWTCHGVAGRGDGPAAKTLVDDWGDRIRVHNFTRPGRFKCGGEDEDLYRLLETGLAGSPMPSYSGALAFAADRVGDLAGVEDRFGVPALDELRAYLAQQPDAAALETLDDAERGALRERRTWALIHYLRSLVQP